MDRARIIDCQQALPGDVSLPLVSIGQSAQDLLDLGRPLSQRGFRFGSLDGRPLDLLLRQPSAVHSAVAQRAAGFSVVGIDLQESRQVGPGLVDKLVPGAPLGQCELPFRRVGRLVPTAAILDQPMVVGEKIGELVELQPLVLMLDVAGLPQCGWIVGHLLQGRLEQLVAILILPADLATQCFLDCLGGGANSHPLGGTPHGRNREAKRTQQQPPQSCQLREKTLHDVLPPFQG